MTALGESAGEKAAAPERRPADPGIEADPTEPGTDGGTAGTPGEHRVTAALAPLEDEHCRVLHDRLLYPRQARVNLDHIVVSAAGNYLIDSKDWSGVVTLEQGSLWQPIPSGGSWLLDGKVDTVRRMAAQMESSCSSVVEPVICLAGENSADFGEAKTIRGVYVVPVGQLAQWLLDRPRLPAAADLEAEATRLGACFPSASDPAYLPSASLRGRPGSGSSRPAPARRKPEPPKHAPARSRRAVALRRPVTLLLAAAVALSVITPAGQRLWQAGAESAGNLFTQQVGSAVTPAAKTSWVPPCTAVTDATVARAVGRKVYRYLNGPGDVCTWGFVPRPSATAPGNLRIATGWSATHGNYPTAAAARYSQTPTSQMLTVPQLAAVPGSAVAPASVSQPMVLVLTWRSTPVTSAQARRAITVLAGEVAKHLPAGPGATEIVRR